MINQSIYR